MTRHPVPRAPGVFAARAVTPTRRHRICAAALGLVLGLTGLQAQSGVPSRQRGVVRGEVLSGRVLQVLDGDTFDVAIKGERIRVRVEGIDCPERGQPFSQAARTFTRQFAFDRDVTLTAADVDRYGRLVARVTLQGQDLSVMLVAAGLARHYTRYSSDARLADAERQARTARRGIWTAGDAAPRGAVGPGDGVAAGVEAGAAGRIRANVRSRVFHVAGCRNAQCASCTRVFATAAEARAAGFRPAGDCATRR